MADDEVWAARFPRLFQPAYVDYAHATITYSTAPVDESLVSRIHVVARTASGDVVVCHLPHPRALWAYAVANVRLVGPPLNPPDGERVVEVQTLPPEEAANYLDVHDHWHADALRHAVASGAMDALLR